MNEEKTRSLELDDPIEFAAGKYERLDLREFTAGEWKRSETHKDGTEQFIFLISFVSKWPVPAVEMLPISKFNEAVSYLMGFMRHGPQTGET